MIAANPLKMFYGCKHSGLLQLQDESKKNGLVHFKLSSQELVDYLKLYELFCN